MFLFVLGGSLVLGAGLLAAASYSDGAAITVSTAAQGIGWLFLVATVIGVAGLRQANFGRLGAALVTFLSGVTLLYVSYFEWEQVLDAPIRHAAAEALPAHQPAYKAALASMQVVMPVATKEIPPENKPVAAKTIAAIAAPQASDACASLTGVESLQCRKCGDTLGVVWIVCQERARLEYCEARQEDEATCPTITSYSPPG